MDKLKQNFNTELFVLNNKATERNKEIMNLNETINQQTNQINQLKASISN